MFKKNFSLLKLNSFKLDVKCDFFCEINKKENLQDLIKSILFKKQKKIILGGGSNILFTENYKGIVIKNNIKGKKVLRKTKTKYFVKVGAGENWHDFVKWTIKNKMYGLENLSLIPGSVGAAPIQNIGAYGVEVEKYIKEVHAVNLKTGKEKIFKKHECEFSYRNSIFKGKLKGKYVITHVLFNLNYVFKIQDKYKDIKNLIKNIKNKKITGKDISNIVIKIRKSKLPDPKLIGNCGSFFKNPTITKNKLKEITAKHNGLIYHKTDKNKYKISAGWMIENCGFKKININNVTVYEKHALVIINKGADSGKHVENFYKKIQKEVFKKYKINLIPEVNVI